MAVFTAFELTGGWIQGLGRLYFEEVPSKGEFFEIPGVEGAEARSYEVLDIELPTDPSSAGDIILTLKS